MTVYQAIFRLVLAVLIGGLIGTERGRNGRAAGMRTHILVCLGATMTAMTGIYVNHAFETTGDVMRLAAQVISGVGFLGAGMIVLKNGSIVKGLTTAAGVWTTATIGIALGYGFYLGAGVAAALFLMTTLFLGKLERRKRSTESIYVELENMHILNKTLAEIKGLFPVEPDCEVVPPKSGKQGHIGISIHSDKRYATDLDSICNIENVVYAVED